MWVCLGNRERRKEREGALCFIESTSHSTVCLLFIINIAVCCSFEDLEKAEKLLAQLLFVPEEVKDQEPSCLSLDSITNKVCDLEQYYHIHHYFTACFFMQPLLFIFITSCWSSQSRYYSHFSSDDKNWNSKRLSDLLKVTQLACDKTGAQMWYDSLQIHWF